jgi:U3 small nucleolar RNA-associated protein 21
LPSIPSLSGDILFKANDSEADGENEENNKKDQNSMKNFDALESPFSKHLKSSWDSKHFLDFTNYMKSLSPSALDMELRMLEIIDEDVEEELIKRPEFILIGQLLDYFINEVSCKNDFEFMQAVVKLFLKIHGETIRCHPSLQEKAKKLLETQSLVWQKMEKLFQSTRCIVTFLSNSQF